MFRIIWKRDRCVYIQAGRDYRMFTDRVFMRAFSRLKNNKPARRTVEVTVENFVYRFSGNEWKKGRRVAAGYRRNLYADIQKIRAEEINEKAKMSKKLNKQRNVRMVVEAASSYSKSAK